MIINKQRGDTIVEVLIAMAVIGIVLGAAFGIANRNLNISRDAQERTEALKLAESQIEILKVASRATSGPGNSINSRNSPFCIDFDYSTGSTNNITNVNSDPHCLIDGLYQLSLECISNCSPSTSSERVYKINVAWERLGSSTSSPDSTNTLSLYYRSGAL